MEKGKVSNKLIILIIFIIIFILSTHLIVANEDDDSSNEEAYNDIGSDDFIESGNYGKDSTISGEGTTIPFEGTSLLNLEVGVYCFNYCYYSEDTNCEPNKEDLAYVGRPAYVNKKFADIESNKYETMKLQTFLGTDFSGEKTPEIKIDFYQNGNFPKKLEYFLGYEGICQYYIINNHFGYKDDGTGEQYAGSPFTLSGKKGEAYNADNNGILIDTQKFDVEKGSVLLAESTDINYHVDWDKNKDQCTGSYKEEGGICCGDDYIWLKNKVINYDLNKVKIKNSEKDNDIVSDPKNKEKFCLYGSSNIEIIDSNTGAYRCLDNMFIRKQYDNSFGPKNKLIIKDIKDSSNTNGLKTDIGLYSIGNDNQPYYCNYYYTPEKGDTFEWLKQDEALELDTKEQSYSEYIKEDIRVPENQKLDRNKFNVCNLYLDGKWTGTKCCYNNFNYNNNIYDSSITYEDEGITTDSSGNVIPNGICSESHFINYANPSRGTYALNGKKYYCNSNTQTTNNYKTCEAKVVSLGLNSNGVQESYYSICNKDNNFFVFSANDINPSSDVETEEGQQTPEEKKNQILSYGFDANKIPLSTKYSVESNIGLVTSKLSYSPGKESSLLPSDSHCCLSNSCWDPTAKIEGSNEIGKCIAEGLSSKIGDTPDENLENTYICSKGEWKKPTPKPNWYNDELELSKGKTEMYNLCFQQFSCACPSGAYSDTNPADKCSESSFILNPDDIDVSQVLDSETPSLCTNKEFFFHNDHLCEPKYDINNQIIDTAWTSRTKLLAMQMMNLAKDKDFTIHCAPFDKSLNEYNLIKGTEKEQNVNSFCIVNTQSARYLGVTFNELNDADGTVKIDMKQLLSGAGFLSTDYLSEPNANCNIPEEESEEDKTSHYGIFNKCNNNNIAYNNKLKALIYSKDLPNINQLNDDNYKKYNDLLNYGKLIIGLSFLNQKITENEGFKSKIKSTAIFTKNIPDFNNFYIDVVIQENKLVPQIFGFIDQKWSKESQFSGIDSLNYYGAVYYMGSAEGIFGSSITCDKISKADVDGRLFCQTLTNGLTFIYISPNIESYQYFSDLTSKLRLKKPSIQLLPIQIPPVFLQPELYNSE